VGSLAREEARVALRLSIRRDPGRRIERESFTVVRQSVVSLKSASKVGTHFCAIPQFHDVDRQTSSVHLASPLTGDPDSLVFALGQATRSFPDSDQQSREAVRTHCAGRQTTAAIRNVIGAMTADEPGA
jgi:hypothetical protein